MCVVGADASESSNNPGADKSIVAERTTRSLVVAAYADNGKNMAGVALVHATFVYRKTAKRHNLRERLMWYRDDTAERFGKGRRYVVVSFEDEINYAEIARRLRTAFFIAIALGRTLILPDMHCGGEMVRCLPIHYFDMENMVS
jgi:hypothetical protein